MNLEKLAKELTKKKERKVKRRLISLHFAPRSHHQLLSVSASPSNPIIFYLHSFSRSHKRIRSTRGRDKREADLTTRGEFHDNETDDPRR